MLLLPIVTPQVVTDIIVTINVSSHSTISLSLMATVNDCISTPAGTLTTLVPPV